MPSSAQKTHSASLLHISSRCHMDTTGSPPDTQCTFVDQSIRKVVKDSLETAHVCFRWSGATAMLTCSSGSIGAYLITPILLMFIVKALFGLVFRERFLSCLKRSDQRHLRPQTFLCARLSTCSRQTHARISHARRRVCSLQQRAKDSPDIAWETLLKSQVNG